MSPEVWAALVSGFFLLLVAIVSIVLPKLLAQGRDIKEVKYQVKNSHRTNLRDDLDGLRSELRREFGQIHQRLDALETKVDG